MSNGIQYAATGTWTPGITNVDLQRGSWTAGGTVLKDNIEMPAGTASRDSLTDEITFDPGAQVKFEVVSVGPGGGVSEALVILGTAPIPTPEAPSEGSMTFREVPGTTAR